MDTRSWDKLGPAPTTVERLLSRLLMAPPVRLLRRAWSENLDVWEFMTLPVLLAGLRVLLAVKLRALKEAGRLLASRHSIAPGCPLDPPSAILEPAPLSAPWPPSAEDDAQQPIWQRPPSITYVFMPNIPDSLFPQCRYREEEFADY